MNGVLTPVPAIFAQTVPYAGAEAFVIFHSGVEKEPPARLPPRALIAGLVIATGWQIWPVSRICFLVKHPELPCLCFTICHICGNLLTLLSV